MYGEDLAHIHEAGFAGDAEAAARVLARELPRPARVVDLGCGGGTLAAALSAAGHAVWGCDASPAMVELARRRAPRARFEVADVLGVAIPGCDAVACVGEVLNYALAGRPLAAADNIFARVHAALPRDAPFLLDVATTAQPQGARFARREGDGWAVEAHSVVAGDSLLRTIESRRLVTGRERRGVEVHRQRLLDAQWVLERLEACGFRALELDGYGHPFPAGRRAFLAHA